MGQTDSKINNPPALKKMARYLLYALIYHHLLYIFKYYVSLQLILM